jgi:succinate dehydrogenase / fumarate reductase membrane anchor subunit
VIFFLLSLHMLSTHIGGLTGVFVENRAEDAISPANSQARDASLFFTVTYIVLLAAALYHGLYGLRTILLELSLKPAVERAVTVVLVVVGIGILGFGAWAAIAARSAAVGALLASG